MPLSTLTRRALIAGAGTTIASAALAMPFVSAAHADTCGIDAAPEDITDRLDRLTSDLAAAMAEYQGGKYKAVVEPDGDVHFVRVNGHQRLEAAIAELKAATEAVDPTIKSWMTKLPSQSGGHWCAMTLTALRA